MSGQQPDPFHPQPEQPVPPADNPWAAPSAAEPAAPAAPPPPYAAGPGQPAAYPGAQQAAYPGAQPAAYPGAQPPAYPGAQPAAYPGAQPPAYPGAQPAAAGYPGAYPGPSAYPAAPVPGYGSVPPQPYGQQPQWGAPQHNLASWGDRAVARLIDALYTLPAILVVAIGAGLSGANSGRGGNTALATIGGLLAVVGYLAVFGVQIYNFIVVQGRTGQSWGKKRNGIRIVHQDTGQTLTLGNNFLRELCHYLDGVAYIGYLWPLWDPMRQTFADKIMRTVVVKA